ncbi:lipoprotein ABC transporter permease [Bdellovibrio bacteriovorus]|uniref:Lipoprotein ABC transporter permease n=1 Tax=Bdellovibrio bacteriovorus TaxID=959 RepID=A0A150WGK9_BDEBC|nr:FtsX-like permease family protein [Bdellovibrio bacteriovorus]KYG62120.1 lipoprotein ABC transporter permease [Bdellovibrio bacteriovorus]
MFELIKIAWRNLFRNPRRTLASLCTVALGAAGLLIYQGFNSGVMNQYRENVIHGYYGYGQVFPKNYFGKVHETPWKAWFENPEEIEKQIRSSSSVTQVFPRVSFYSFIVKGGITLGGKGEGVIPERENAFFTDMNFISGGNLQSVDEVILGKGLAESLDAKVGDTVTLLTQTVNNQLNGADLKVSGIFFTGKKVIDDSFYRVDLKQAHQLLDTNRIEMFSLATKGVEAWPQVEKDIHDANSNVEAIPFEILDKNYYQNSVDFLNAQFAFIRSIILVIVAMGIFNVISVGLLERAGEMGALRANGEKRSRLFRILLIENSLLGTLGGFLGICLAVLIDKTLLRGGIPMPPAPGITRQFIVYLDIMAPHYVQALLLPMIATVLASLYPTVKLLKKSIPELLRST